MRSIGLLSLLLALAGAPMAQAAGPGDRMAAPAVSADLDLPLDAPLVYAGRTKNTAAGPSAAYFTLPTPSGTDGRVKVWFIDVFQTPSDFEGKQAAYAPGLYLIECATGRSSLQRGTLHAADGALLVVMDRPQPWTRVDPDHELNLMIDRICAGTPPRPDLTGVAAMLTDAADRMN